MPEWANIAVEILRNAFSWINRDWDHLRKGWKTLAILIVAGGFIGFSYAKRVESDVVDEYIGINDQHTDAADWRLSNFLLDQKALEFTSEIRETAAGRLREMTSGNPASESSERANIRIDYEGEFRPRANELRKALADRLKPGSHPLTSHLEKVYNECETVQDLEDIADDIDSMRRDLPPRRSIWMWVESNVPSFL